MDSPRLFATDWYEDITEQLRASAQSIKQGSIVTVPGMQLHEALPAFQIGSEKIDTGSPERFSLLKTEIESAHKKFPLNQSMENVKTFMDALAAAEMAWHAGYSPVQSVTSNLLVEEMLNVLSSDPKSLIAQLEVINLNSTVKTYVLAVVLSVAMAMDLANASGALYPEEDLHCARPWMGYVENVGGLSFVVDRLEQCLKHGELSPEVATRLQMRLTWITVLRQRVPKKYIHLDALDRFIPSVLDGSEPMATDCKAWFTTGCQSRVDMECLRLEIAQFSLKEARELWQKISQGIRRCVSVFAITKSVELLGFFLQFSIRQEPAIVKAVLKQLVQPGQCVGSSEKQWAIRDVCETAPPMDLSWFKQRAVDRFISQAALCYHDLLTCFCQNRCRLREGLSALIIAFDSLQVAAGNIDDEIMGPRLSSWVYFRKLQIMQWTVLLSFETQVVGYRELAQVNWFGYRLAQYLLTHLGRMRSAFEVYGKQAREAPGYSFLVALELESQVLSQLLTAEYMLFVALHRISPPHALAANGPTEEMLFKLRFQMFQSVGVPTLPTLEQFKEEIAPMDTETALRASANASQSVKQLLNSLGPMAADNPEIPKLKRSAIGLSLAVTMLVRGHRFLEMDYSFHPYFPVPKTTP